MSPKLRDILRPYWFIRARIIDKYYSWKFGKKEWEEAKKLKWYGQRVIIVELDKD
jgi:hypothetical protein